MPAGKVPEAGELRSSVDGVRGGGNNPAGQGPKLPYQSLSHGMGGFAKGDHEDAAVSVEVEEVVADAEYAARVVDVAVKGGVDARLFERVQENVPGGHAQGGAFMRRREHRRRIIGC